MLGATINKLKLIYSPVRARMMGSPVELKVGLLQVVGIIVMLLKGQG